MKNHKTLVLFDVGAVLLGLEYNRFYEEASKISKSQTAEQFKKNYISSNIEYEHLSGSINKSGYLKKLKILIDPKKHISDEELKNIIGNCWSGQIDETVELKKKNYKAGYSIGIFSNISKLGVDMISSRYPEILETYDKSFPIIYSFEVGSVKPKTPMYKKIKGYDKVILIDDKESYLKTGIEQFGWYGILFTPYIDKAEAIRAVHNDATQPLNNFRRADSISDLEKSLKYFGINI